MSQHLSEFTLDERVGILVDGVKLEEQAAKHKEDKVAESADEATMRGFWSGAVEALDWIGITKSKWSSQDSDICALETLATAEGIPTSRQSNHMHPETLVGCSVGKNLVGQPSFHHGETNGIFRTDTGANFLGLASSQFKKELSEGYRKGVETAFLHYIAIGRDRVNIHPIETLSQAFSGRTGNR